jgi:biofilm protein TabA
MTAPSIRRSSPDAAGPDPCIFKPGIKRGKSAKIFRRVLGPALLFAVLPLMLMDCCTMRRGFCAKGECMVTDKLEQAERYFGLHPAFQKAFTFLRLDSLSRLSPGRHDIDGDRMYCMISAGPGKKRTDAKVEAHRKYIDIQYVMEGTDEMGWKPAASCGIPDGEYDEHKDVIFYKDKPRKWTKVPAGSFAIFFPRDAHAPMVGDGEIRKAVIKVAVE